MATSTLRKELGPPSAPASHANRAIVGLPPRSAVRALPTSCPHQDRKGPLGAIGSKRYNRRSDGIFAILRTGQFGPSRFRFIRHISSADSHAVIGWHRCGTA